MTFWKKELETKPAVKTPEQPTKALKPEAKPAIVDPVVVKSSLSSSVPHIPASTEPESLASRYSKVRSALGAGTVIQGKLSFDTAVSIDGKLSGEIFSTEALIVGASGLIDAQVEVKVLVVSGTVRGRIVARERIELLSGGRIEGTITTPCLKVEEASVLNAKCTMTQASTQIITLDGKDSAPKTAPQKDSEAARKEPAKGEAPAEQRSSLH